MFKSVFTRYVTTFLLIILIAFTMLAAVISARVSAYNTKYNEDILERTAANVQRYIQNEYIRTKAEDFSTFIANEQSRLIREVSTLAALSGDTAVFAVDRQGVLILHNDNTLSVTQMSRVSSKVLNQLEEEGGTLNGRGTLDGMLQGDYMYCARSLDVKGENIGAVFVCLSSAAMNSLLDSMVKTIIMAILWILLATLIGVYFISERITRPLKDMSRAAKSFAAGRFDVRVTVMGNDEVSELARAFNNMAESLSKQEELRRTFLANVSHDLRTPMTTIGGFIDGILAGAIPPEKQNYYLEVIAQEVRRLSRLVNSLLDISRIQAGERKFNPQSFDICEMGRQILISFEQKIEEKKLQVSFDTDADHMYVMADKDAVHQIFYNICDNAVKFSREGGCYEISITAKDRRVYVSVYNEGQGIAPEDLPYVFDRFYKSDRSRGLDKTGTGLGLFIAKTIINAHNEQIKAESEYGKWCRFTFTLPYVTPPVLKKDVRENKSDKE